MLCFINRQSQNKDPLLQIRFHLKMLGYFIISEVKFRGIKFFPKFEGPKVIGFASVTAADLIKTEENAYE